MICTSRGGTNLLRRSTDWGQRSGNFTGMREDRDATAAKCWEAWGGLLEPWWRYRVWIAGGIALLYVLAWTGVWRMEPDSALYANLGRSLAAGEGMINGKGLADDSPVGLPLVLALTGGPGRAVQTFMLACAGLSLGLGYLMLRRAVGVRLALAVILLTATNRLFFEMSVGLLTEIPFMVGLMMVGLGHEMRREGCADGNGDRRGAAPRRAWALIGLGFVVMGLFRSVALVVAAAYVLNEAWDIVVTPARRRVGWLILGAGVGGAVLAWAVSPAMRDDVRIFMWHAQAMDLRWMASNFWDLMTKKLVELVFGLDLDRFTALVFSGVVVAAGFRVACVSRFWAVLWAVSLVQWVVFMPEGRYAMPMLPMVLLGMLLVGARLTGWLAAPHRERVRWVLLVVIAGANAVHGGG